MTINYIDLIILSIVAFSAVIGLWKGFVRQLFGLIALFLGLYCAFHFSGFVTSFIMRWIDDHQKAVNIISFAITFIAVVIGVGFVGKIGEKLVKIITLGLLNRIIGLLFSVIKTLLILCIAVWLLQALDHHWPFLPQDDCQQSSLFEPLSKIASSIFPYIKNLFSEFYTI